MNSCRTDTLIEVFSEHKLYRAWEQVAQKHTSPGIDHVSIENFNRNVAQRLHDLRSALVSGHYTPDTLIVFPKAKASGGFRELSIATVRDRIAARCAANALNERLDHRLQPQSYAYRPHRSALRAVSAVQNACHTTSHVLRLDIASFFDSINHDILHQQLLSENIDESFVDFLMCMISQPRFDGVEKRTSACGVPQGSQLAPILSNLYLDSFDRQLCEEHRRFIRYADDIVAFTSCADEAGQLMNQCTAKLESLALKPNLDKTRIYRIDEGFLFLGFVFNRDSHVASLAAKSSLKNKLSHGAYDDEAPAEWTNRSVSIIRGWNNYFEHETRDNARKERSMKFKRSQQIPITRFHASRFGEDEMEAEANLHSPISCVVTDLVLEKSNEEEDMSSSKEELTSEALESTSSEFQDYIPTDTRSQSNTSLENLPDAPCSESNSGSPQSFANCLKAIKERKGEMESGLYVNEFIRDVRNLLNDDEKTASESQQREALRLLAGAYRKLGLYGAAWRCLHEAGSSPKEATAEIGKVSDKPIPFGARDVETWLQIFGSGPAYNQFVDRIGRSGYRPYTEALQVTDLKDHWQGKRTLSVSVYDTQGLARFGVIDFDISRQTLEGLGLSEREALRKQILDDARHLLERAHRVGIDGAIEDSCLKGYHLWFFFRTPLSPARVREFLNALNSVCGPPPEGTHRELFPASDTPPEDALNSRIRLPLGIHRLTGERSHFLTPQGAPCAIGSEIPGVFSTITGQRLHDATFRLTSTWSTPSVTDQGVTPPAELISKTKELKDRVQKRDTLERGYSSQSVTQAEADSFRGDPLSQVSGGCAVLRALKAKATDERHLTHAERIILRGILVPLGESGINELHAILSHCSNYNRGTTEKYISTSFSNPMGCNRIREILGEFADQVGCSCSFKPRKNSYANPMRHIKTSAQGPVETSRTASMRDLYKKTDSGESPRTSTDPVVLLSAYRTARQELLAIQNQLLSITSGSALETKVGVLRMTGADIEILRWQIAL